MDNSHQDSEALEWFWHGSQTTTWHSLQSDRRIWPLAGFAFLEHYFIQTQVTNDQTRATICACCNTQDSFNRSPKCKPAQIPNPNWSTKNDYDLHAKIFQMIWHLPIKVLLFHVKGHQDNDTPIDQLPYEAQLNIPCDKPAHQNLATLLTNTKPHPVRPATYPHLYINGQVIVRQILDYLRESHLLPTYKAYLMSKFQWQDNIFNQIEWQTMEYAMQKLAKSDHIQI